MANHHARNTAFDEQVSSKQQANMLLSLELSDDVKRVVEWCRFLGPYVGGSMALILGMLIGNDHSQFNPRFEA